MTVLYGFEQLVGSTSRGPVHLNVEEKLKLLMPAGLYYWHKVRKETSKEEPELALLSQLVPSGTTAIDVGANRGIYSYMLAKTTDRVEAFEPNPALTHFLRIMLGWRVRVNEFALSNIDGVGTLHVPFDRRPEPNNLVGSLYPNGQNGVAFEVKLRRRLDSFGFEDVGFIKIDVEGSEREVLEGARSVILRDRPKLLIELLASTHQERLRKIAEVQNQFDYDASIVVGRELVPVSRVSESDIKTRNVLFTP